MKNLSRLTSMLLMTILLTFSLSIPTFAALTQEQQDYLKQNPGAWQGSYVTSDQSKSNSIPCYTDNNGVTYYYLANNSEEGLVSAMNSRINAANANGEAINNVSQIAGGLGTAPDFAGATGALQGFVPIINIFLGIVCTLIVSGMTIFTAFDVCYIVFPVFRNKCEDAKATGTGIMAGNKTANGGNSLRFVSDEAQYVVKNCTLEQGKNPLTAYLAKRSFAIVMVSIILFILITGNITLITNIALKVVSGIMNILSSLA